MRRALNVDASFFSQAAQEKLAEDIKQLADPVFLVSDEKVAVGTIGSSR
jgi:hypothetical protein